MPLLASEPDYVRKATHQPTVLIAENDEVTREVMSRYLLQRDYEVETAAGGVECLEKLRCGTSQIVVLDSALAWGGSDGVLAVMREEPGLAHIPVVLTTPAPGLDEASLSRGTALVILEKPFSLESLLDSIRVIERTRASGNHSVTGRSPGKRHETEGQS